MTNWLQRTFRPERRSANMTMSAQVMWVKKPDGSRERIFCKACLLEGREWLTPEPCEHVLQSEEQPVEPHGITQSIGKTFDLLSKSEATSSEPEYPYPTHSNDPETGRGVPWDPELDRINQEKPRSP